MERRFKDKKVRGPSITLERQEKTTVKRAGDTYIQRKHTRVRELFTRTVNTHKTDNQIRETRTFPASAIVSTPIVEQPTRPQETSTSSDTRLRQTEFQLQALNQEIEHEIFELKRFRDNLLNKHSRTRSKKESRIKAGESIGSKSGERPKGNSNIKSKKTWGENLASNKKKSTNNMLARSYRRIDVFLNDEIHVHSPRIRNMGVKPTNTTEHNDKNMGSPRYNANNSSSKRAVAGCTFGHCNDELHSVYQSDYGHHCQCGQQNCRPMCPHFQQYNASTMTAYQQGMYSNLPTNAAGYQYCIPCTPLQLQGVCMQTQANGTNITNERQPNRENCCCNRRTANRLKTDLYTNDTCRERRRLEEGARNSSPSPTQSKRNDPLKQSTISKMKSRKNAAPGISKNKRREVEQPQLPKGMSDISSLHKYQVKNKEKLIKVTLMKSSNKDSRQDISPEAKVNTTHEADKQQLYEDYLQKYNAEKETELLQMDQEQSSSGTKLRSDTTYTKLAEWQEPPQNEIKESTEEEIKYSSAPKQTDSNTEIDYSNIKKETDDTNLREVGVTATKEQLEKDTQVEKEKRLSTFSQTQTDAVTTKAQESQSIPAEEQQQEMLQDTKFQTPVGANDQSDVVPPPSYQNQTNRQMDLKRFPKHRESQPMARVEIRDSYEKALTDFPRRSLSDSEHLHLRRCMAFEQRQCNRTKMRYVTCHEQSRDRGSTANQQIMHRSEFMHYDRGPQISSYYNNSSPQHVEDRRLEFPYECPRMKNSDNYINNSTFHVPCGRSSQRSANYSDACTSTTSITTAFQEVTYTTRTARNLQDQQQPVDIDRMDFEESNIQGISPNNGLQPSLESTRSEDEHSVTQRKEPLIRNDQQLTSTLEQQEDLEPISFKNVESKHLEKAPQSRRGSDDYDRAPSFLNSPQSFEPRQNKAAPNYVSQSSFKNKEYYSNSKNYNYSPTPKGYVSDYSSSAATTPRAQYAEQFRQPQAQHYPANVCQISQCAQRFQSRKVRRSDRLARTVTFKDECNNVDNTQGQNMNRNDIDWERSRHLKTDYQLELENNIPEYGSSEDDCLDSCRTCSSGATIRTCLETNPDDDYMTCDESQGDDYYEVLPAYTGCPCMYDTYLRMASHCAPVIRNHH